MIFFLVSGIQHKNLMEKKHPTKSNEPNTPMLNMKSSEKLTHTQSKRCAKKLKLRKIESFQLQLKFFKVFLLEPSIHHPARIYLGKICSVFRKILDFDLLKPTS